MAIRKPKKPAKKTTTKKTVAKKKTTARKTPPKPAKKTAAKKKTTAKKAPVKKTAAKKPPVKKTAAKKAPVKRPAKPAADGVSKAEFEAFVEEVTNEFAALRAEMRQVEARGYGYGDDVTLGDDGVLELNLDTDNETYLREWCYIFGFDYEGDIEELRDRLKRARAKKSFKGFSQSRQLPIPTAEEEAYEEEEEEEPEVEEEEEIEEEEEEAEEDDDEVDITPEMILNANWTELVEMAEAVGLDYDDIDNENARILRNRFLNAMGEEEIPEDEEEEGDEVDWSEVEAGTAINVDMGEDGVHEGIFQGIDDEGDIEFVWEEGDDPYAVPAETVSLA